MSAAREPSLRQRRNSAESSTYAVSITVATIIEDEGSRTVSESESRPGYFQYGMVIGDAQLAPQVPDAGLGRVEDRVRQLEIAI